MANTSDVEAELQQLMSLHPTVVGWVCVNLDGIPVKYHEKMSKRRAVDFAGQAQSFCGSTRKAMKELLTGTDADVMDIRMRTSSGTELMFVLSPDYTLVLIQNCTGKAWDWGEEAAAGDGN